jgi:hypothetical protein
MQGRAAGELLCRDAIYMSVNVAVWLLSRYRTREFLT